MPQCPLSLDAALRYSTSQAAATSIVRGSSMNDLFQAVARFIRSPAFKLILVGTLVFILLVPIVLVAVLVGDREQRANGVRAEVAGVWGQAQLINGPVLIVPFSVLRVTRDRDRRVEEVQERRAVFLPDTLRIKGQASTQVLHRSIFDVPVYAGELSFEGRFAAPQIGDVAAEYQNVRWHDAVLALAITDVSGLKATADATINSNDLVPFEPSIGASSLDVNGIHVKLSEAKSLFPVSDGNAAAASLPAFDFHFSLKLNGSSELNFAPVARETAVELASDWPHPSFAGAFLPAERNIRADGFSARWQVPHLARSVPQAWDLQDGGLDRVRPFAFGARFYVPLDFYDLIARATKYGVMFVATAFMAVFLLELRGQRQVHPVQYFFVGFAMVFFYVLLLSLAEHIGFTNAYVAAAAATGGMLSVYVARVQASMVKGFVMLLLFALLYGVLYMILQLEDYALLAGAVLGFILLTVTMFSTLRVEWSGRYGAAAANPAP
jgi:inner membrane protein